jgi:hypothetical protein
MKTLFLTAAAICAALSTADAACNTANPTGSSDCPVYTAPATTSVPHASMGGSISPPSPSTPVILFNGAVPPNGFMISINAIGNVGGVVCSVNDNGTAEFVGAGFLFSGLFVTPPGYKPMGPVSVLCQSSFEYRGW